MTSGEDDERQTEGRDRRLTNPSQTSRSVWGELGKSSRVFSVPLLLFLTHTCTKNTRTHAHTHTKTWQRYSERMSPTFAASWSLKCAVDTRSSCVECGSVVQLDSWSWILHHRFSPHTVSTDTGRTVSAVHRCDSV